MLPQQACRNALIGLTTDQGSAGSHSGLVLDCYLRETGNPESRRALISSASRAQEKAKALYTLAYKRWDRQTSSGYVRARVVTEGRLILGLGIESVLETGLRLHATYGTPLIPGSSLKGLCSHYCAEEWGRADERYLARGEWHDILFGKQDDAGMIRFMDAWILPASVSNCLAEDVMTPHQGAYYGGAGAPSDRGDPNPIAFLSVKGVFLLALECDDPSEAGRKWAQLAMDVCKQALREWGAGGKTRAGYGRMRTA